MPTTAMSMPSAARFMPRPGGFRRTQALQPQDEQDARPPGRGPAASGFGSSASCGVFPSQLEHPQHAVGDHEPADHVDRRRGDGDEAQHVAQQCPDSLLPGVTSEPTSEMPEMALVADISGVCNSGETPPMTSKPTKPASTRM